MVNKKVLLSAIAGVATLGVSMASVAGGNVACEHCQAGHWYVSGKVGYGNNHWDNLKGYTFNGTIKHDGFAGGVDLGYAFNQHLALEGGFMYLPRAKFNGSNDKWRNYAFDLVVKATAPLDCLGLDDMAVFGKAGASYLRTKAKGASSIHNTNLTYAFGASWAFMPNMVADVTYQRYHGEQRIAKDKYQPSMDAITVGVTYTLDEGMFS